MKSILLLISVSILSLTVYAQVTTKSITSQIVVRNDQGVVYENRKINLFYKFGSNYLDMKACKGFLFTPSSYDVESSTFQGFSIYIRPENWIYIPDQVKDGAVYKNNCSLMYIPKGNSAPVEGVYEVILIKYYDGTSTFMIIGFDGERTLIVKPDIQ